MIKGIVKNWQLIVIGISFLVGMPTIVYCWARFIKKKNRQKIEIVESNKEMVENMIDHGM